MAVEGLILNWMDRNSFLEELEDMALQMVNCRIIFISDAGLKVVSEDRIRRVFAENGHWFIETGKGLVLGSERLIEVGGRENPGFGSEWT